jgi:hypothetical protein
MQRALLIGHLNIPQRVPAGLVVSLVCVAAGLFSAGARADEPCANEALRTSLSVDLPDCRAYEMVSPAFKEGASLNSQMIYVSSDGSHAISGALGAFAGTESESSNLLEGSVYEFSRKGVGWEALPLDPPASEFPALHFLGTSRDLTKTLWEMREPSQSVDEANLYVREADGRFVKIGPLLSPSRGSGPPGGSGSENLGAQPILPIIYVGASADLSHVFMSYQPGNEEERSILWPGDTTLGVAPSLYEYAGTGVVRPRLVGIDEPEGKLISNCGTELGSERDKYNAISVNGEKVFFTAFHETHGGVACSSPVVNELYAHINRSETVQISEPSFSECKICRTGSKTPQEPAVTEKPATFWGASEDGAKVFFTTEQELLEGQSTESLYEFDFDNPFGQRVVLVSKGSSKPEVQGVARVSEDGSHVYFVAKGVLTTGVNREGGSPTAGEDNLYMFERDGAYPQGRVAFIATLSAGDEQDWMQEDRRPVQATPDGRFLIFDGGGQVFEYDAKEERFVNISMGHAAEINGPIFALASSPAIAQSELDFSSDGANVFFTSTEALTPGAEVAAGAGAKSVYEYHSAGSITNGSVSLISDGKDISGGIALYGVDSSGGDVFFQTADSLVGTDANTGLDLYDARVDGGFPEPVVPVACAGEACQGTQSSSPLFGLPGSLSVAGGGNLAPAAPLTPTATKAKPTSTPKSLTRAQKLADALKACGKRPKKKRAACDVQARKRYGGKSGRKSTGGRTR